MATFEGYERREAKILAALKEYGISSIDECRDITLAKGIDVDNIVRSTQPICFENAIWAYTVGAAIAIKAGCTKAADAAAAIGIGLQSFCIPGSVAENRKVGLGHGNLGKMLLSEETECFCFLAGHESFTIARLSSGARWTKHVISLPPRDVSVVWLYSCILIGAAGSFFTSLRVMILSLFFFSLHAVIPIAAMAMQRVIVVFLII